MRPHVLNYQKMSDYDHKELVTKYELLANEVSMSPMIDSRPVFDQINNFVRITVPASVWSVVTVT